MLIGIRTGSTSSRDHEADVPTTPAIALVVICNNSTLDVVNECQTGDYLTVRPQWEGNRYSSKSPHINLLTPWCILALTERSG